MFPLIFMTHTYGALKIFIDRFITRSRDMSHDLLLEIVAPDSGARSRLHVAEGGVHTAINL